MSDEDGQIVTIYGPEWTDLATPDGVVQVRIPVSEVYPGHECDVIEWRIKPMDDFYRDERRVGNV